MPVHITLDGFKELDRYIKGMDEAVELAARHAVSRTTKTARAHWAREIAKEINLPVGVIKEAIRIAPYAGSKSLLIEVDSRNSTRLSTGRRVRSIPVMRFNPVQMKRGVAVKIKKSKGRQLIKSAWIGGVKASSGKIHAGVFYRTTRQRLPIQEAKTTAVEEVAIDTIETMKTIVARKLSDEFRRQLTYQLSRRK